MTSALSMESSKHHRNTPTPTNPKAARKADYKSRVSFQKVLTSCLQLLST
ncbi:unnamed protein product [Tenebrio molitor]|nr:unnamed protein product [Tenebrio molitor]